MIILHTNYGDIAIELDIENTPKTAENFVQYIKSEFYDGTIFHRVIKGFMIQGGGFKQGMIQKPTNDTIQNEAPKAQKNKLGSIAMARTSDPHSASSQFFINVSDNHFLDFKSTEADGWGYCVFGQVTDGIDIVKKISLVQTTSRGGHADVPVDDVIIQSIEVVETQ
jgi:peptidyl-prolyl cis-trans isomerase B (cyclophilin B)